MFRTTSMPAAGLSVLAGDLRVGDRIVLDFGDVVSVLDITPSGNYLSVTVSDGVRHVETLPFHRLIPVELAEAAAEPVPVWKRVLRRGLPWWAVAVVAALACWVFQTPPTGGTLLVIVACWLFGCLAMVTTPEEPVR
jgi:hypothetical protein